MTSNSRNLQEKSKRKNLDLLLRPRNQKAVLAVQKPVISGTDKSEANQGEYQEHSDELFSLSLSLFLSLCEGTIHQKFVPPGQTVSQHNNQQVLELEDSKSAHDVPNDSETKTDWFTVTMRRRTLLCQRANFWTLTRGSDSPPFLLEWSGALWFILVSENEIVTVKASLPGYTEYSRTMADCPTCDFKK